MKKITALLLISALALSLTACSEDGNAADLSRQQLEDPVVSVSSENPRTVATTPTQAPQPLPHEPTARERRMWQEGIDETYRTHWGGAYGLYADLLMFRIWDEKHKEQFNMTFEDAFAENHAYYERVWQESSDMIQEFMNEMRVIWGRGEQATWFYDIVGYFGFTREELNRANRIVGELLVDEEINLLLGDDVIALNQIAKAPLSLLTEDGMLYSAEWLILTPVEEIHRAGVTTEMIDEWLEVYAEIDSGFSTDYEARFSEALSTFLGEEVSLSAVRAASATS